MRLSQGCHARIPHVQTELSELSFAGLFTIVSSSDIDLTVDDPFSPDRRRLL